ncbi:RNA-binding motif protein, X-linked 2 isoform X2 [Colius striatus]|uniref:RNA-binding motif protein, X-linked 2 isoform X1 n=1 Tax=Colius striatus TaxID=57412 RepID=UPI002B1D2CB9|nr:RNA-binding motif protein, X-linked 2 isoform X1 [Colius striatus]XP_061862746.1 RNA-binding motif protein, X-linked 2 isoform X2 [Colius striatus]
MNPLTKVKLINELNAREAELGVQDAVSWHAEYKDSAWIFIGGLPYELTEGDVICVFSQYGEVVNINLVRDKKTGKSKGFCFLCYEDQRSTILAVDNFNGIKIKGRTIRVDHVANYQPPKDSDDLDEVTRALHAKGCGVRTPPHTSSDSPSEDDDVPVTKQKGKEKSSQQGQSSKAVKRAVSAEEAHPRVKIKKEKEDPAYERCAGGSQQSWRGCEGKPPSRAQREEEEEERRHQRSAERRGEKSYRDQRGHSSSWEERERREEAGRKGSGHGSRREEPSEGGRSRERRDREPHGRHSHRGSPRSSRRC